MATPVIMPKQGQSVESCLITVWHKKKGEKVCAGDLLFSYETDKAAFEEEAGVEGTLLAIFFDEGEDVPVLTNVCVIGEEGEDASEFDPHRQKGQPAAERERKSRPEPETQLEPGLVSVEEEPVKKKEKIKISPRARNLAAETGIDYRHAAPTGPQGRIIARDITALQPQPGQIISGQESKQVASGGDYEEVTLTGTRKLVAERMYASLAGSAQVTLNTSFDASELISFRKQLKQNREMSGLENITLTDMIVYAVARTILNYRELNAHLVGEKMLLFHHAHIGVAVDTERGLMVPTLFNAERKTLNETAGELKKLAAECREGRISPDYLKGAGFTVTNLGALGIESFTPVLNLPQTGILGVNAVAWRIKEQNGEYIHYPAIGLSLTFDHRAIDGAPAARFLRELTNNLENFTLTLCK